MSNEHKFEADYDLGADRGVIDQNDPVNEALREELLHMMQSDQRVYDMVITASHENKIDVSTAIDILIRDVYRPNYEQRKLEKQIKKDKSK